MLAEFVIAGNHNSMRATRNQSPLQIWTQRFYTNKSDPYEIDPQFDLYSIDWDAQNFILIKTSWFRN